MMKSETTKLMEILLAGYFADSGEHIVFECDLASVGRWMKIKNNALGVDCKDTAWLDHLGVVDAISATNNGIITCFELKATKSDFRSKAVKSFFGDWNYYVMPEELYEQFKDEIPDYVGVYVIERFRYGDADWQQEDLRLTAKKYPTAVDCTLDKVYLLSAMVRASSNRTTHMVMRIASGSKYDGEYTKETYIPCKNGTFIHGLEKP